MISSPDSICLGRRCKDITGIRSGKLVARYPVGRKTNTHVIWHCECDCGGSIEAVAGCITMKHYKSCGCESSEIQPFDVDAPLKPIILAANAKDITGVRSGKLVARYPVGKTPNNHILWYCECDCGGIKVTNAACITAKSSKSCGCQNADIRRNNGRSYKDMKRPINVTENGLLFIRDDSIDGYLSDEGHYKVCKESGRWWIYGIDNGKEYMFFTATNMLTAVKRAAAIEQIVRDSGATSRWPIFKLLEQGV